MRINDFRRLALSMPHAEEHAHMGHPDFRVKGRIFASLYRQEQKLAMVKLRPDQQKQLVRSQPRMFAPIPGGWGRQGATEVRLASASSAVVRKALLTAWRNAAPVSLADQTILVDRRRK